MENISTEQLIQEFLKKATLDRARKGIISFAICKRIIQRCENELGTEFIKMNYEQFLYVISAICDAKEKSVYATSYEMYYTAYRVISQLVLYYSQNICPIRNPFLNANTPIAFNKYLKNHRGFLKEDFEKMISKIHQNYDGDFADYLELIPQMFYCGFQNPEEILKLKKNDINFNEGIAIVDGHRISLSKRCVELLLKLEHLNTITNFNVINRTYSLSPWNGSYFKFYLREETALTFDDKPMNIVAMNYISKVFINHIAKGDYVGVKYSTIVLLGFYEFCVSKIGEEEMAVILKANKETKSNKIFMDLYNEYDYKTSLNPSRVKTALRTFLPKNLL